MRLILRSPIETYSGYGNDGIDLALSLNRAGVDVVPFSISPVLPGLPQTMADLFTKDPTTVRPDAVLTFAPPFDVKPTEFAKMAPVAIGYSMWEKSKLIPQNMIDHGWPNEDTRTTWWRQPGFELAAMVVTCDMNVEAFQALEPGLNCPVVPCGIEPDDWPVAERKPGRNGPMRFAQSGMLADRKDPFLMLDAWRELKAEHPDFDAVLEMKTLCPGLHPKICEWIPDVIIHEKAWNRQKLVDWYHSIDVLVSTSRGEGNNKPAMEMLATGGTVLATDWSGHDNWLRDEHSYRIPGELRPVFHYRDDVLDFRADKEALKAQILHCWSHPDEVAAKGLVGAQWIRDNMAWDLIAQRMIAVFRDLGLPV